MFCNYNYQMSPWLQCLLKSETSAFVEVRGIDWSNQIMEEGTIEKLHDHLWFSWFDLTDSSDVCFLCWQDWNACTHTAFSYLVLFTVLNATCILALGMALKASQNEGWIQAHSLQYMRHPYSESSVEMFLAIWGHCLC